MNEKPKLCVECRNFRRRDSSGLNALVCMRPSFGVNIVTGEQNFAYADAERYGSRPGQCGKAALFWEPLSADNEPADQEPAEHN